MADWAIYWRQFLDESGTDGEPVTGWLTNRGWLVDRLNRGDRIWLFIGGDACGDEEGRHRAYVAELLVVDNWGRYSEHDPGAQGSPRFHIHGIEDRCILLKPPVLADDIVRRPGTDSELHIGIARQTPFELDGGQVGELLALIRNRHHAVYEAATKVLPSRPTARPTRTRGKRHA